MYGTDYMYVPVVEGEYTLTHVPHKCHPMFTHGIKASREPHIVERCDILFAEMREQGVFNMKYTRTQK